MVIENDEIYIGEIDREGEMCINVLGAETYLKKDDISLLQKYFAQKELEEAKPSASTNGVHGGSIGK